MASRVRDQSAYHWVRRAARGSKWQARPHTGPTRADNFNLGLYPSDAAAWGVVKEFRRRMADMHRDTGAMCPAEVLVRMQAAGVVRADVLPRWVKRVDAGYVGIHKLLGGPVGPFPDPVAAYRQTLLAVRAARAVRQSVTLRSMIRTETPLAA